MKAETIKAIFTNLLFVIGVILMIVGFIKGASTTVKLLTFDVYPLNSWEESRCEQMYYPVSPMPTEDIKATAQTPADMETQKQTCLDSLNRERAVRKTDDIVLSLSFFVSGVALVVFFRRFILR